MPELVVPCLADQTREKLPEVPGVGLFLLDDEEVEWLYLQSLGEREENIERRGNSGNSLGRGNAASCPVLPVRSSAVPPAMPLRIGASAVPASGSAGPR